LYNITCTHKKTYNHNKLKKKNQAEINQQKESSGHDANEGTAARTWMENNSFNHFDTCSLHTHTICISFAWFIHPLLSPLLALENTRNAKKGINIDQRVKKG
jgi:hypothetical protein